MVDTNKTEIVVIMDRSGSMVSIKNDMIGGFASFIEDQRKEPGELRVSLYQFDGQFEVVYEDKAADEVGTLPLEPRGYTALIDAVCLATKLAGKRFADRKEEERPGAVIVLVITDGCENSSKEYTKEQLVGMIKEQETKYRWKYVYLGSDAAGFAQAKSQGFSRAANYAASRQGVTDMYCRTSESVRSYRQSVSAGDLNADLETPSGMGDGQGK